MAASEDGPVLTQTAGAPTPAACRALPCIFLQHYTLQWTAAAHASGTLRFDTLRLHHTHAHPPTEVRRT